MAAGLELDGSGLRAFYTLLKQAAWALGANQSELFAYLARSLAGATDEAP